MRVAAGDAFGRTLRTISPSAQAAPMRAQGFDAAQQKRRLSGWVPSRRHVNSLLASQGGLLVSRTRDLVRNNPYAGSAAECFVANLIGTGVKPSSTLKNRALRERINAAWLRWTDEADADGLTDLYGLQAMAAAALVDAGEVFVRFRARRAEDGLSVPLQLQMIPAEQCPANHHIIAGSGNVIRSGIEFDAIGRRVAYHFHRTNPADDTLPGASATLVRVPADQVLHVFDAREPGQIRGVPRISRAAVRLFGLDLYEDAELARKQMAAAMAGFITQDPQVADEAEVEDPDDAGASVLAWEAGTVSRLGPGEDIKFSQPADVGPNFEAFEYRNLIAAFAAVGVPYAQASGDLRYANYSSLRAGLVEFRRRLEQLLWRVIVFQLCRPVWTRWFDQAVLAGTIKLPGRATEAAAFAEVKWIAPKWDWVDPERDRKAELIAVQNGFKARSDVIEAEGEDAEAVDARIKADREREQEMGLSFGARAPAKPSPADAQSSSDQPRGQERPPADAAPADGAQQASRPAPELAAIAGSLERLGEAQARLAAEIGRPREFIFNADGEPIGHRPMAEV